MPSTENGEATELPGSFDTETDAAEAILKRWEKPEDKSDDATKPSEDGQTETPAKGEDETAETEAASDDRGSEETPKSEEGATAQKKYADSDETYVKIKEGDKEHEVSVKELKRLFGQEAALTRKSQEVAEARKKADDNTARAVTALNVMVQRAQEAAKPYKALDFLALAKDPNISAEELAAVRQEAQRHLETERFLSGELDNFMKTVREQQQVASRQAAQECLKALNDSASPHYVKDWSNQVYDDLRQFAVKEGVHQDVVNGLTDAPTFKLLHMAYMYQKSLNKPGAPAVTKAVNKTPKKISKTSQAIQPTKETAAKDRKKAMENLRQSGSTDAAAEAFLARWKSDE